MYPFRSYLVESGTDSQTVLKLNSVVNLPYSGILAIGEVDSQGTPTPNQTEWVFLNSVDRQNHSINVTRGVLDTQALTHPYGIRVGNYMPKEFINSLPGFFYKIKPEEPKVNPALMEKLKKLSK